MRPVSCCQTAVLRVSDRKASSWWCPAEIDCGRKFVWFIAWLMACKGVSESNVRQKAWDIVYGCLVAGV